MTLVHDLLLNFEVLVWHESGSWNGLYCLLAVENETYCVQFLSGLTSFRSTSIKPYFRSKNTYNIKPDKPEVTTKPNELKTFTKLDKLETTAELDEPEATAKSNKLKAPLPTPEVPQKPTKPTKPTIKRGQGRP